MTKSTKPENVKITLPINAGVDGKGQSYDVASLYDILDSIPFDKVSINLQIDKKHIYGEEARGKMNIGFITGFDREAETISAILFNGKNIDKIKELANGAEVYMPVSLNRSADTEEVKTVRTIIGFDLVPAV